MTHLEAFMTPQKGYMGQQEGVYDLPGMVNYTLLGFITHVWGDKRVIMTCIQGFMTLQKGIFDVKTMFRTYLEGFMTLQKGHMG